MTTSRGERYYCSARREKSTCDADRGIGARELERRVLKGLKDILLGNETLVDEFAAEFKRELARLRTEDQGLSRRILKERQQVERGIKRCLDFITNGDGDPGSVRDELRRLETRKREIDSDLKARPSNPIITIHPNLPDLYSRKINGLQQMLANETVRPQAVEAIRSLIDRIEIHPGEKRGQCDVLLVGALAHILDFAHKKRTAAHSGGGGTYLMVAGLATSVVYILITQSFRDLLVLARPQLLRCSPMELQPIGAFWQNKAKKPSGRPASVLFFCLSNVAMPCSIWMPPWASGPVFTVRRPILNPAGCA